MREAAPSGSNGGGGGGGILDFDAQVSLPVYDRLGAIEESERDRALRFYLGDPEESRRERLRQGGEAIKDRARKRKYLTQVLERRREKQVEARLWKETHALDAQEETIEEARRRVEIARENLLREAELAILQREIERVKHAKVEAARTLERLRPFRAVRMALFLALLAASVCLALATPALKVAAESGFRGRVAELIRLEGATLEHWLACDALLGSTLSFLSGSPELACVPEDTVHEYYLYNITNVGDVVTSGALPHVRELGPFPVRMRARKRLHRAWDGWVEVDRQPYFSYVGDEALLDLQVTTVNAGFWATLARLRTSLGQSSDEAVLVAQVAVDLFHRAVHGAGQAAWLEESTADSSCFSLGCFIARSRFSALEADVASQLRLFGLPIFGADPLTDEQASVIWAAVGPDAEHIRDASVPDFPKRCSLLNEDACARFGPAVANLHILLRHFMEMWAYEGNSQSVLTTLDLVRLENAKESGDFSAFYESLWTRDPRCQDATRFLGSLRCVQLHDLGQYFLWLFQTEWDTSLHVTRGAAKGPFVTRTARQLLLSGFEDATKMVLAGRPSELAASLASPPGDLHVRLAAADANAAPSLTEEDRLWLRHGWVRPLIHFPSARTVGAFAPHDASSQTAARPFANLFVPDTAPGEDSVAPHELERRSYMTGTSWPRGVSRARYLGLLNGEPSVRLFGQTSALEGFDGAQFPPSFDFAGAGAAFDESGQPFDVSGLVDGVHETLDVFNDAARRPSRLVLETGPATLEAATGCPLVGEAAVEAIQASEAGVGEVASLPLRWYDLQYSRFTRLKSDDAAQTTCMLDVSMLNEGVAIRLGYPNFQTCNSTVGETPATRVRDTVEEDDGFVGDSGTTVGAQVEEPLPLDERAVLSSMVPRGCKAAPETMNRLLLEPVTGTPAFFQVAQGFYMRLSGTFLLGRLLAPVNLPTYSVLQRYARPADEVEALASALRTTSRLRISVAAMSSIVAVSVGVVSAAAAWRFSRRPELAKARIRPLQELEREAAAERDKRVQPIKEALEKKKAEYAAALKAYQAAKSDMLQEMARDGVDLLEHAAPGEDGGKGRGRKG